jgi:hypothetical protein
VELSPDEVALLTKGTKFSIYKNCDRETILENMEAAFIKHRREERHREGEDKEGDLLEEDQEERDRIDELRKKLEAESRTIFSNRDKVFDWNKQRATDCKGNVRIILPKAMGLKDEAMLAVLRVEWNALFDSYLVEECGEGGEQLKSNLTSSEKRGLKSLRRRVKEGTLVVMQTDKSGKFAIMDMAWPLGHIHQGRNQEHNQGRGGGLV